MILPLRPASFISFFEINTLLQTDNWDSLRSVSPWLVEDTGYENPQNKNNGPTFIKVLLIRLKFW